MCWIVTPLVPVNQINSLINIKELVILFLKLGDEPQLRGTNRLRFAVRFFLRYATF